MRRQHRNQRTASWWLILFSSASLVACGGGNGDSGSQPEFPVNVVVTIDTTTVQPGGTAHLTATVNNDAAQRGVTWTVSCPQASCGTVSPTTTASGSSTTYTAPAEPPVGDLAVTITATSESNVAARVSTVLTVSGISVSIASDSDTVPAGTTAEFTATVTNDATNSGVNWTVTCDVAPCGAVSPTATASGAATTYTAPTTHPLGDLAVGLTAISVGNVAASASILVTVPGVRVTIAPDSASVPAGTTAEFTATVTDDPDDGGVTWTVICDVTNCGTVSPSASASGTAVVYTAPATAPVDSFTVNLVATSVTLPSSSGGASITIPSVTTSVTPISALIPLNVSQEFTATVGNDTASNGVSWTLSRDDMPCSAECGSVSPSSTASDAATAYTAPGSVPATADVQLIATSVTDPTKSGSANVTLTTGSVKLVPADLALNRIRHTLPAVLTNTGASALTISSMAFGGSNPDSFSQTNDCGTSLGSGESCTIEVTFSPPNSTRQHTANLVITDSSTDSPQLLHLTGLFKPLRGIPLAAALENETTAAAPRPTGPNTVGTRLMHFIDSKRQDPYLANGMMRELMVRFWYPAPSDIRCVPADYTSPEVLDYISGLLQVTLPRVSTNSCLDASISVGAHPIVVFTHGFTGTFTDYTYLFEDLASRGYVVASIDHTHEATAVEFPDGRLEKSVYGSYLTNYVRSDPEALNNAVSVRLDDLRFVLDELQRLNAQADGTFTGEFDLSRVALAGHSLGGLTAILGVGRESRFKAGISLDGLMPFTRVSPTRTPLLMVAGGREQWNDNECRLWDALRGPRAAVNLKDAEHFAFSDAVWLAHAATETGTTGPDKTVAAIRDYVAAFLDANLRSKPMSLLLTKASPQYPEAALTTPGQALCSAQ